jgi:hypothetical protein
MQIGEVREVRVLGRCLCVVVLLGRVGARYEEDDGEAVERQ